MIQVVREWEWLITIKENEMLAKDIFFSEIKEEIKEEIKSELNVKLLREKLKEKWVKFFPWAKDEKVIELAKENVII